MICIQTAIAFPCLSLLLSLHLCLFRYLIDHLGKRILVNGVLEGWPGGVVLILLLAAIFKRISLAETVI